MNLFALARQKTWLSSCLLLMIALAFALKAIIPAGFMPTVTKDGFTKIVICAGTGEKTILLPSSQAPIAPDHNGHADKICSYQIISSYKLLINLPTVTVDAPKLVLLNDSPAAVRTLSSQPVPSVTARGPPAA